MNGKSLFLNGLLMFALAVPGVLQAQSPPAPNFIVIMADDLGYADVGFNGGKQIPTPHIDSIAGSGIRFSDAYTSYAVCAPSRAGFMTGRYQQRFGFERNPQYRPDDPGMGLPLSESTLADLLKEAGYTSGVIGKWHLGAHPTLHPLNRGFDFFYGHLGGGHHYFPELLTIEDSYSLQPEESSYKTWILKNHEPVRTSKYLTDEFSDEAVSFVERNRDKPFFLFLSYNAPHTPLEAPESELKRFSHIKNADRRTYAAMVSVMDQGIGRVLDKLEDLGIEEKTLVFFLSDNGGATNKNAADNRPLRGQKSDVWEGGFRVPFAMSLPGTLPTGSTYHRPVSALDIFATIASLANAPLDADRPLDGVDLVPYLTGEKSGSPHDAIYLRKFDQQRYAVRQGEYKLVISQENGTPELYNLADDIGESKDLYTSLPQKAEQLEALRRDWDDQLIHPVFLGLIHLEENIERWGRPKHWLPPKKQD